MSSRVFSGGRPGMFLGNHGKSIDIPIWLGQKMAWKVQILDPISWRK